MGNATKTRVEGQSEMVFTMGIPGSGKSTVVRQLGYEDTHGILDPDIIKQTHPDYDPTHPELIHEWSQSEMERQFMIALTSKNANYVIDGTGTNSDKMVRRITEAKAAGFWTTLLYVQVPLTVALQRNAIRERTVPEAIVRQKALDIHTSFSLVAPHVDNVIVKENL